MFHINFYGYKRIVNSLERLKRTVPREANDLPYKASVDCLNLLSEKKAA